MTTLPQTSQLSLILPQKSEFTNEFLQDTNSSDKSDSYEAPSYWENIFHQYRFIERKAQNQTSLIWVGSKSGQSDLIALKITQKLQNGTSERKHQLKQNSFMQKQKLKHTVIAFQIIQREDYRLMTMPLYESNLQDLISRFISNQNKRNTSQHENFIKFAFQSMLAAVKQLQNAGYVHRDLKPDNFLVDLNLNIVLSDLELITKQGQVDNTISGTLQYMAPERLSKKRLHEPISFSSDIWALGVILYEMFTGNTPFKGDSAEEVLQSISQGLVSGWGIPSKWMRLIRGMLKIKKEKRLTLEQIQNLDLLQGKAHFTSTFDFLQ